MKILFVVSDDILHNTSANIRNTSLIRGFLDNENAVQIVCLHHAANVDEGLTHAVSGSKVTYLNTISVKKAPHQANPNGIKRKVKKLTVKLYNMVRVYDPNIHKVKTVKINPSLFNKPDVIISSSDPRSSHVLALRIRKCIGFTGMYVQYWGDPMMNDISASDLVKPMLKAAEKKLLHSADLVVYTNDATKQHMCEVYRLDANKAMSIPTSCAICKITAAKSESADSIIRLGYFGEYYSRRRNVEPLFQTIIDNEMLSLVIAGPTDCMTPNSERIYVYPLLDAEGISRLQNDVDILIVIENLPKHGDKNSCFQIPGKVYHYGVTDKKVLVICETGITQKEMEQYGRYMFCENSVEAISNAAINLFNNNSEELNSPVLKFMPQNIAKLLTDAVSEVKK